MLGAFNLSFTKYIYVNCHLFQNSRDFIYNKDPNAAYGHKWRLKTLWKHLREVEGLLVEDLRKIWSRIKDLVIMSILGGLTEMRKDFKRTCQSRYNSYKLLGETKKYSANDCKAIINKL